MVTDCHPLTYTHAHAHARTFPPHVVGTPAVEIRDVPGTLVLAKLDMAPDHHCQLLCVSVRLRAGT